MKIRIRFGKKGYMKFVGHLDIMRFFQKAIRRADIDIAYTEGFSPHQKMSFASPLGVGLQSSGEYLDIELNEPKDNGPITSAEAVERLNATMVEGMNIYSFKLLPKDAKNAMSIISAADYFVAFRESVDSNDKDILLNEEKLANYMNQSDIRINKKTKKSEKTVDIKPMIHEINLYEYEGMKGIFMKLMAGSSENLKPELVIETLFNFNNIQMPEMPADIYRLDLYADGENGLISLDMIGEDII